MRTIAHISDLHFGRNDDATTAGLLADLAALKPDLVAISGDLTQRARRREFIAARAFLAELAAPSIAVPGNHDVPLFNLPRRVLHPLHRFRRYISPERLPFFNDGELAVLGINTARSASFSNGRISHEQLAAIRSVFATAPLPAFRILVTHHPLTSPPDDPERNTVGRADDALAAVAEAGVELLLAGHYHRSFSGEIAAYHLATRRSVLVSQAGTAISTRRRDEVNSYNLLEIDGRRISCVQRGWDGRRFAARHVQRYAETTGGWTELSG
jgi:3',5'-cyclic AMP phosphodiesterase CpdA